MKTGGFRQAKSKSARSTTAELYNDSTETKFKNFVKGIRGKFNKHGTTTRQGMREFFAKFDTILVDNRVSMEEFSAAIPAFIPEMPAPKDLQLFMSMIDADKSGYLEFEEFCKAFQPPLTKGRGKLVLRAWKLLEPVNDLVPIQKILDHISLEHHPFLELQTTIEGYKQAADRVQSEMIKELDPLGTGQCNRVDWIRYFEKISCEFEDHDEFGLVMSHMLDVSFIPSYSLKKALRLIRKKVLSKAGSEAEADKRIRYVFTKYDANGDRTIDEDEFLMLLTDMGVDLTRQELKALYSHFDVDGNCAIDLVEFKDAINSATYAPKRKDKHQQDNEDE